MGYRPRPPPRDVQLAVRPRPGEVRRSGLGRQSESASAGDGNRVAQPVGARGGRHQRLNPALQVGEGLVAGGADRRGRHGSDRDHDVPSPNDHGVGAGRRGPEAAERYKRGPAPLRGLLGVL